MTNRVFWRREVCGYDLYLQEVHDWAKVKNFSLMVTVAISVAPVPRWGAVRPWTRPHSIFVKRVLSSSAQTRAPDTSTPTLIYVYVY